MERTGGGYSPARGAPEPPRIVERTLRDAGERCSLMADKFDAVEALPEPDAAMLESIRGG